MKAPPIIQDGILTYVLDGSTMQIAVDSSDWHVWVQTASTFTFRCEHGSFTARKERAGNRRGNPYWRAYRTRMGKLERAYLGRSQELTLARLQSVAGALANKGAGEGSFSVTGLEGGVSPPSKAAHLRRAAQAPFPPEAARSKPWLASLPVPLTSFIGRDQEMQAICDLLSRPEVRLLTITGTGGVGKTRLALEVTSALSADFADGTCFVPLAPVSDPARVMAAIAQALGLWETADLPPEEQVPAALRERHLMLVLDNFEHLLEAALHLVPLLTSCPRLLVTSRAALHLSGEHEFPVSPLALPDLAHLPEPEALTRQAAVQLFVLRTQAIQPTFHLTPANARAIAGICVRLDGLPLAIELAAARIKLLPPQALLARLGQRLAVLTSGARDAPARQQTLRNTIQWSYHLLDEEEQRLFRRLSVFVGGCILQAIESVCAALDSGAGQVLEGVTSLLDKSLVQQNEQEGGEPRLTMLETVREYGLERLRESGEADLSQRAHALYYLALAEEAEPHLKGAQQVLWWQQLEREQENLRAALAWLIEQEEGELALRLSVALWWFWYIRGYWSEGWRWLEATLELPQAQGRTERRAKALCRAGIFATWLGHPAGRSLLEESVAISRELGDKHGLSESLGGLGMILHHFHSNQTGVAVIDSLLGESLALAREVGDSSILANALRNMAEFMRDHGDYKSAHLFLEESVTLYRALKDRQALSRALRELADALMFEGQFTQAAALAEQSLAMARELSNGPDITRALYCLGAVQLFQGDVEQATVLFEESLALAREQGDMSQMQRTLFTLAGLEVTRGDLLRAERYVQESLALLRELRDKNRTALALSTLGDIKRRQGDLRQARAICTEGVVLAGQAGHRFSMGWNLIALAMVLTDEGQPEQAARLFGVAESWLNPSIELDPAERADYEMVVKNVRAQLGEKTFVAAWSQGRALTPEHVLAALEPTMATTTTPTGPTSSPRGKASTAYPDGLTAREVEVLRLVAQGLTDAQIAEHLVISPRTVNWHLTSIYSKLGVSYRAAATRCAIEHQLY